MSRIITLDSCSSKNANQRSFLVNLGFNCQRMFSVIQWNLKDVSPIIQEVSSVLFDWINNDKIIKILYACIGSKKLQNTDCKMRP